MKSIILIIPVLTLAALSCNKSDNLTTIHKKIDEKTAQMVAADNDFGLGLFKQVIQSDDQGQNIMVSPVSVQMALAMTYNGATGETRTAMENTLKKNGFTNDEINKGYQTLIDVLKNSDPKVTLELANSIWYRQDFAVLPDFISTNQYYYYALTSPLDFNSPNAKDIMNEWVSDKTHGKITSIIDDIPDDAVMFLINAVYFKGIWRSEFDKAKTTDETFTLESGSEVQVPMMQQQDTFRYAHNSTFQAVELPYGDGDYSMVVLLPAQDKTAEEVINNLDQQSWDDLISSLSSSEVVLHMPKLKFEYKINLNDLLTAMGMGIAFTDSADFSGINPDVPLKISKVIHKTYVEVNEEGTEAAAVTSVGISYTAYPGEPVVVHFTVNRPYIFAITERNSGSIVFIGLVNNPLLN